VACAVSLYLSASPSALLEYELPAAKQKYNLLVDGFRSGTLNLKIEVPKGLAELADPYDPQANAPYRFGPERLHDSSYYRGKLYIYFGPTPALTLFWPWLALTGHYLSHEEAVIIYCTVGFLASAWLLLAVWRRYFPESGFGLVLALLPALALASGALGVLQRPEVYEVAISCAYAFSTMALDALWYALQRPAQRGRWLAAASFLYGLAVAARPSMAFGAIILLIPVIMDWRSREPGGWRRIWLLLGAAVGPIGLLGLGVMAYNQMRFGSPLEFGTKYILQGGRAAEFQTFRLRYFPYNLWMYFFDPSHWSLRFPFLRHAALPAPPAGHEVWESSIGILTALPVSWLALAAAIGIRSGGLRSTWRWFLAIVAALFVTSALTICLYRYTAERYELDFLPALLLLAAAGALSLDCIPTRRLFRSAFHCAVGLLLFASLAFAFCSTIQFRIYQYVERGNHFLALNRLPEAAAQYEEALRLRPDFAEAHNDLAQLLAKEPGRQEDAIAQFEAALRVEPGHADAQNYLAVLLASQRGRQEDAIDHFEAALRLSPDYAEAHNNLANLLASLPGRQADAIDQYEAALRIRPDYANAHYNFAVLLAKQPGRQADAALHFRTALKINPNFAPAREALQRLESNDR
jgi:tetratricopeptide (TPR) repeat protein